MGLGALVRVGAADGYEYLAVVAVASYPIVRLLVAERADDAASPLETAACLARSPVEPRFRHRPGVSCWACRPAA